MSRGARPTVVTWRTPWLRTRQAAVADLPLRASHSARCAWRDSACMPARRATWHTAKTIEGVLVADVIERGLLSGINGDGKGAAAQRDVSDRALRTHEASPPVAIGNHNAFEVDRATVRMSLRERPPPAHSRAHVPLRAATSRGTPAPCASGAPPAPAPPSSARSVHRTSSQSTESMTRDH
jgi:hypothetical protein